MQSKELNGVIYKITSPSGKIYIGQSVDFKRRLTKYRNLRCKTQTKLYNSLKKYGFENHTIEIVKDNIKCMTALNFYEELYIKKYDTFNTENGLNLRSGGMNNTPSDETRQRMSNAHKGNSNSSKKCYTLDILNKRIIEFESITNISKYYNCYKTHISIICLGQQKTFNKKQYTAAYNLQDFVDRNFLSLSELESITILKHINQ
jgi:hypothetical protein